MDAKHTETPVFQWRYDETWELSSCFYDDDYCFTWRIRVHEDGLFYVDESDQELTDWKSGYETLAAAKAFCETAELLNRSEAS